MDNPKTPPAFTVKEFKSWKTRVRLWQKFTDVPPEKQSYVLASTCVSQIPDLIDNLLKSHDEQLSKNDGVEFLLAKLDEHYGKSTELDIFDRFVQLINLRRKEGSDLSEYLSDFRTKFDAAVAEKLDMQNLCSLLVMANGSFSGSELALVKSVLLRDNRISALKVDSTCSAIKTILVDSSTSAHTVSPSSPSEIKTESINYSSNRHSRYGSQKGYGSKGKFHHYDSRQRFDYKGQNKGKGKGKSKGQYYGSYRNFSTYAPNQQYYRNDKGFSSNSHGVNFISHDSGVEHSTSSDMQTTVTNQ